jgi:hypothetical protein
MMNVGLAEHEMWNETSYPPIPTGNQMFDPVPVLRVNSNRKSGHNTSHW